MKLPPKTCDRTLVIVCKLYFSISESAANRQTEENETQREREGVVFMALACALKEQEERPSSSLALVWYHTHAARKMTKS